MKKTILALIAVASVVGIGSAYKLSQVNPVTMPVSESSTTSSLNSPVNTPDTMPTSPSADPLESLSQNEDTSAVAEGQVAGEMDISPTDFESESIEIKNMETFYDPNNF